MKKFNWLGIVFITIVVIIFTLTHQIFFPVGLKGVEAFGHPGICPTWSPANLTVLGTAANPTSQVWFTGFDGILGEVFYPEVDTPATVDWQFLVGDANHTWVDEEKRDTTHQVTLNNLHSLSWTITNTAKNRLDQIQKTIFTDPNRNTLIQQVTFTALKGTLRDFHLYTLYHPALDNQGRSTTGYSTTYNKQKKLVAKNSTQGHVSALVQEGSSRSVLRRSRKKAEGKDACTLSFLTFLNGLRRMTIYFGFLKAVKIPYEQSP
ncbi:glycosyl hydrolase [Allocoleopsis franciscana]|uniref:Glycosyl hydrolase, glucoamylase n=1 Tax=Allocoleopsis franciscana PCC 7113 TaxID=1173027 RepID=K9WHW0_9CYAN|nr:glycosyl hydrolase [Allocoleopsis franciscana]AFZ19401.1 glycosyl hydrolase, glucoamylase [Allocoleopsis franciscana PCC 7113]